jgi:hypothetical protein
MKKLEEEIHSLRETINNGALVPVVEKMVEEFIDKEREKEHGSSSPRKKSTNVKKNCNNHF